MKVNMNDYVKVKLTDEGIKIYNQWARNINESAKKRHSDFSMSENPAIGVDGFYHENLWKIFQIFGSSIFMGCKVPFMDIHFFKEN